MANLLSFAHPAFNDVKGEDIEPIVKYAKLLVGANPTGNKKLSKKNVNFQI